MTVFYVSLAFLIGSIYGTAFTTYLIRKEIRKTRGLSPESKAYVFLLLGIRP